MCGISGFIDFNNRSSPDVLKISTDTLGHRGPDGSGYEFFQNDNCQVGLGHRRLAIIDLTDAGKQPMKYKQWYIVFNGEMYNYAEVKKELEDLGHRFISHSDTEVILHAWEQWGSKMISRFIGMFAFVIYDEAKKEMICFRDRAGVKPFYYYWQDGLFLFASELKAFHKHPDFKKEIEPLAVHQFMQYGYVLAPLSIFKHTFKIEPGHFLTLCIEKEVRDPVIEKYWDIFDAYNKPKLVISEKEALEETEKLLLSACKYRMVADVPVGVFLSGGYDSSVVTALLQRSQTEKIRTYTIGFHEESHNEAVHAKAVAEHLGTAHTEYYCTTKEAQDIIPDIAFYCDEPFGDASIIPTTLVSRLARKEVTVALSADAGDEIFAGYNKYTDSLHFLSRSNLVPSLLKKPVAFFVNIAPDAVNERMLGKAAGIKKDRLVKLLKDKTATATNVMDELLSQNYSDRQLARLFNHRQPKPFSSFHTENLLLDSVGPIDKMLAVDYKTYLPDDILVKIDRAGMTASLEGREPLLDHRLAEFAAQLPHEFKLKNGIKKYLLKKIVHKYLPEKIMSRPKMGFGVPVHLWLRNELKFYAEEFLDEKSFAAHGFFNQQEINIIKKQFFAGNRNYNNLFWFLLVFQMWYKKWM
ncbi:MAG: asparagine synthase (glutamine-hydrolyzing) [Ferruginibacter sp.]